MTLSIHLPESTYDGVFEELLDASRARSIRAYLVGEGNVPLSPFETTFVLRTSSPGETHVLVLNGVLNSIVPSEEISTVQLQLVQGVNKIVVTHGDEEAKLRVVADPMFAWFAAAARERFLAVDERLLEVQAQLSGPWTTRLSAHLLDASDVFIKSTTPSIMSTRMALAALTGRPGFADAVRLMATAIGFQTPVVQKMKAADPNAALGILPSIFQPAPSTAEHEAGRLFHIWSSNYCAAVGLALARFAENLGAADVPDPKPLSLVDVDDFQVVVSVNGRGSEVLTFDPGRGACDISDDLLTCSSLSAFYVGTSSVDILLTSPSSTFDNTVVKKLGFGNLDSGSSYDGTASGSPSSGLSGTGHFDNVEGFNPFGRGFVGLPLDRRFDGSSCLDTRVQRAQRASKFTLVPNGDVNIDVTGQRATVTTSATGAPPATSGTTTLWAACPQTYQLAGSRLRQRSPAADYLISSIAPVEDFVYEGTTSGGFAPLASPEVRCIFTAPVGFFQQQHVGCGLHVSGASAVNGDWSIVSVADDGSSAVASGRTPVSLTAIPSGLTLQPYEPLRLTQLEYPEEAAGQRIFAITLATALTRSLVDEELLDLRLVPTVHGSASIGGTSFSVYSDTKIAPGDLLYITPSASVVVTSALASGARSGTTGHEKWDLVTSALPSALTAGQSLYGLRTQACPGNGAPVTPFFVLGIRPASWLVV